MRYVDNVSDVRNVDPSAVVFPSSISSPFNFNNRLQSTDSKDLQKEYLHAVEALFAVTTRLKIFLGKDINKNIIVSPISTTTVLGEILLGARGKSRRQLLDILTTVNRTSGTAEATVVEFHQQLGGLTKLLQTSPDYDESYQLELANAMFLKQQLRLHPHFLNAITDLYAVDIEPMDFRENPVASMKAINLWASRHTRGVIDQVFSEPLPTWTSVVLTNAIYFKGDWETPFNPDYTIPGSFKTNKTHDVNVQYMRGVFDLLYVNSSRLGCRMIALPYKHANAAMYVILPDSDNDYNIQAFASELSVTDVRELISSAKPSSVTVTMPKMTLTQSFSILEALVDFQKQTEKAANGRKDKKLVSDVYTNECEGFNCSSTEQGYEMSCNSSAELEIGLLKKIENKQNTTEEKDNLAFNMSGASPDKSFKIDDIFQNIFLDINEIGTVAAAVSVVTVDKIGDYKNFVINRPFVFFIRQEITGTPLFWGTIVDPTNGNNA